eukprot:2175656-Amphidinium_carterae.1
MLCVQWPIVGTCVVFLAQPSTIGQVCKHLIEAVYDSYHLACVRGVVTHELHIPKHFLALIVATIC